MGRLTKSNILFISDLEFLLHPLADLQIGGSHQIHVFSVRVLHFVEQSVASGFVALIGATEMKTDAAGVLVEGGPRLSFTAGSNLQGESFELVSDQSSRLN